ncbi:hypothetical protein WG66_002080 [Moniliophthora roreri]|nr:hypothetical protein WG66_002080 [Moniliophthora roreri]
MSNDPLLELDNLPVIDGKLSTCTAYESDESGEVEDDVPGESECESDSMDVDHNNSSITTSPTPADGSTSNASPRPTDNHPVTSNATVAIPGDNQISGRPSRLRRGRNIVETEAAIAENHIVTCKSKGCETRFA